MPPIFHHRTSLLQIVASLIGGLNLAFERMRKTGLGDLAGHAGLGSPRPK